MEEDGKRNVLLHSWKEIASYLGCDVRTCQRWQMKYKLPIHRAHMDSPKSRVFAYKDELDKWFQETFKNDPSSEGALRPEALEKRSIWGKTKYLFVAFSIFVAGALIYVFFFKSRGPSDPYNFKVERSSLVILDQKGKELWRFDTGLENLETEKEYRSHFQFRRLDAHGWSLFPHLMIRDINQDGHSEVLFSLQTLDELKEGVLICFDYKGQELWRFKSGREMQFGDYIYSADYRIWGFDCHDLDHDDKVEIIVFSKNRPDFPCQIVILDYGGHLRGEYWNSGHFEEFLCADLDKDGKEEIVICGTNNEYGKGCLLVFDSSRVKGSSPQLENKYRCKELEPGSQKVYILFP